MVREPAIVSRWLLFGSESLQTGVLFGQHRLSKGALLLLGGVLLYNAVSLFVLRRTELHRRAPIALLLIIDLLLVCAASYVTGASKSPFLGQFYLIIFAGALFFGLPGGVATGIAAAILTAALGVGAPDGLRQDVRDLLPYFAITGGFTGHLSDRVRESARLRQGEAEREKERARREEARQHEMQLARTIQEAAALADGSGVDDPSLEVVIHRVFAREVGGDFALTFPDQWVRGLVEGRPLLPGTLGLVVGDVAGKGVPAALTANSVAYLLPWLRPLDDVGAALSLLNRDLVRRLPASSFVTLVMAEVLLPPTIQEGRQESYNGSGLVRLWSAGHPPALLWHAGTNTVEVADEDGGGPVLGIFAEGKWQPQGIRFDPGDILVLYTDGLSESRRAQDGELLGTARIAEIVAAHAGEDAATLSRSLARAAAEWGPQQDDLTILVCRYKPK